MNSSEPELRVNGVDQSILLCNCRTMYNTTCCFCKNRTIKNMTRSTKHSTLNNNLLLCDQNKWT